MEPFYLIILPFKQFKSENCVVPMCYSASIQLMTTTLTTIATMLGDTLTDDKDWRCWWQQNINCDGDNNNELQHAEYLYSIAERKKNFNNLISNLSMIFLWEFAINFIRSRKLATKNPFIKAKLVPEIQSLKAWKSSNSKLLYRTSKPVFIVFQSLFFSIRHLHSFNIEKYQQFQ